eukprot:7696957-Prorocentrum_lima.AAC.1
MELPRIQSGRRLGWRQLRLSWTALELGHPREAALSTLAVMQQRRALHRFPSRLSEVREATTAER